MGIFFRHTVDKDITNYCGLTLNWNYPLGCVDISMPNYVPKYLIRLNYKPKTTPQHSLHKNVPITCSKKRKEKKEDESQLT